MKTLKDILKPPFKVKWGTDIANGDEKLVLFIKADSFCANMSVGNSRDSEKLLKQLLTFVAESMNEKWQRDFGKKEEHDCPWKRHIERHIDATLRERREREPDYEKEEKQFTEELKAGKFDNEIRNILAMGD